MMPTGLKATAALRTFCFAFVLALTIFHPGRAKAAEPILISLSAQADVDGESVLLGQISQINGTDPEQVQALQSIVIGRAPLPGQSSFFHRSQVEMRLKQNDIAPATYQLTDAGPITVTRNDQIVSAEQIAEAVRQFIEKSAPWNPEQMQIRPIRYDQAHKLCVGELTLQVIPPKHTDWLGAVPFRVNMLINGRIVKKTSVPTYIEVWQDVVLAVKPLGRNQPITRDDLDLKKMNIARVPGDAMVQIDQVLGRRANRAIAVNSVLRSDQIDLPPLVRKGDVVQVLAESPALRITTQGVAQENGAMGEYIEVLNTGSKKRIHAQVVDAKMVRVTF